MPSTTMIKGKRLFYSFGVYSYFKPFLKEAKNTKKIIQLPRKK
jgi:hypothetical protein